MRTPTKHGTLAGYQSGCRCENCKRARRIYDRKRDARHQPARLTRLRSHVFGTCSRCGASVTDPEAIEVCQG